MQKELKELFETKIYEAMDSFLVESGDLDGTPYRRSIDRLNMDRRLFVKQMNEIILQAESLIRNDERKKRLSEIIKYYSKQTNQPINI